MQSKNQLQSSTHHDFFSNSANAPSYLHALKESRVILELGQFIQSLACLDTLPTGDGHPVLVIPGFLTDDRYTALLRWLLKKQGYTVIPWQQGTNLNFNLRSIQTLQKKITTITNHVGKKISIIGWSLGGIYARYISNNMPNHIRHTITLGTPFSKNMSDSIVTKIFELLNRKNFRDTHPDIIEKITSPIPVASTSIYSKMDGVISWQCSICPTPRDNHEHVEILSSHCGLTHNPAALYTIAERLSLPEHNWKPFDHDALERYLKLIKDPKQIVRNIKPKDLQYFRSTFQGAQEIYNEFIQPTCYFSQSL